MPHPITSTGYEKYYFTFGCGQKLAGCYVVISATSREEARTFMMKVYGAKWGFSYDEKDFLPQIEKYGLREVPFGTPNEFTFGPEAG
jgi:hypothetical protein